MKPVRIIKMNIIINKKHCNKSDDNYDNNCNNNKVRG